jgi:hypothetical protein
MNPALDIKKVGDDRPDVDWYAFGTLGESPF